MSEVCSLHEKEGGGEREKKERERERQRQRLEGEELRERTTAHPPLHKSVRGHSATPAEATHASARQHLQHGKSHSDCWETGRVSEKSLLVTRPARPRTKSSGDTTP